VKHEHNITNNLDVNIENGRFKNESGIQQSLFGLLFSFLVFGCTFKGMTIVGFDSFTDQ